MNRTVLLRRLGLGLATLTVATAGIAATMEDAALSHARSLANDDSQVAVDLQKWIDQRDIAMLANADGLITNDMRSAAEDYAIAAIVEADGLVSAQLMERVAETMAGRYAAADGLVIDGMVDVASSQAASADVIVASKATTSVGR